MVASVKQLAKPLVHRLVSLALNQKAQLTPERILTEYRQGRFPMAVRFGRIIWHDPEPRAIMPLDDRFHVPSNVRKLVRKQLYKVTFDQAFSEVVKGCAAPTERRTFTWISPEVINAYIQLYEAGYAHSFEVWNGTELVGGGFGVALGGLFSGESMFSRETQVAKIALVHLVEHLRERGFVLQDAQMASNFSRQFGVLEIARAEYKALLAHALTLDVTF